MNQKLAKILRRISRAQLNSQPVHLEEITYAVSSKGTVTVAPESAKGVYKSYKKALKQQ